MITVIEGVPGSGKSYYASHMIAKHHCVFDEFTSSYQLKDNVALITNVEDLKLNNINLDLLIEEHSLQRVFSIEYFKHMKEKFTHVIFIIDEAQRYFEQQTWGQIAYSFQYHRHLGIDMYIITQDASLIPRGLVVLSEFVVRARSRSLRFGFVFVYDFMDTTKRLHLFTRHLKPAKDVFKLYKSYEFDEGEKPKNALYHWMGIAFVFILIAFFGLKYTIFNMWGSNIVQHQTQIKPSPAPEPLPSPVQQVQQTYSMQNSVTLVSTFGSKAIVKTSTGESFIVVKGESLYTIPGSPRVEFIDNCRLFLRYVDGSFSSINCNRSITSNENQNQGGKS